MPPRPSAASRGYDTRWRAARTAYLASRPTCVMCADHGRATAATVVDHIKPHRGDPKLFWDRSNWQALCATHHNAAKQRGERRGGQVGCDLDGWPLRSEL